MTKDSKLTEKGVRMPDIRNPQREAIIAQYLREVQPLHSESPRSHRFAVFLQQILGIAEPSFIENYCVGFEQYIRARHKDRILKGRADNLFGSVIIEFEANLARTRAEAEAQLQTYAAILWSQEAPDSRTPYICLAADGVRFISYTPTLADPQARQVLPEAVKLNVLEDVDWSQTRPDHIFFWLDRYFLRREIYAPTSEKIEADFGLRSHAFQTANAALLASWRQVKERSAFAVVYDAWDKYLRIVYGSKVAGEELFVRHTYLATLAKLMAWVRLNETTVPPGDDKIIRLLEGLLFKEDLGINNFLEEDFFSWVARDPAVKTTLGVVRGLFSILQKYNLRELSEDVLKSLYQELVDPETRHDLGEFYTPDWLAHRMVNKMLDANVKGALLDPTCGSGTFLYLAIKEKKERLGATQETLRHILESVCGVDIHPLAVIIAKTNYLLALGDLLKKRPGPVSIPVFLADTNFLPEREMEAGRKLWHKLPGYRVRLDSRDFHLPDILLENLDTYDRAIELARDFACDNRGKKPPVKNFRNFLQVKRFPGWDHQELVAALFEIVKGLKSFMEDDRDTIWAYVLKNIYKPLFFRNRFDFIMGNPPWISFRFLEAAYQEKMKNRITREYRLLTGRGELITQLEIGALFLLRTADLYLKPGGDIGFVLPRAVFTADQHDNLRRGAFKFPDVMHKVFWQEAWDCDGVSPLFNVPSCVLWGKKLSAADPPPRSFPGQVLEGKLPRKNASLAEAQEHLTVTDTQFSLNHRGKRTFWAPGPATATTKASPYKSKFFQGASIVPRSFWFVRVKPSRYGFDSTCPPLETDPRAIKKAKAPYKNVKLSGNVESRFFYATLLSTDLLPFGHLDFRLVVLPIIPEVNKYQLLNAEEAKDKGYTELSKWLLRVEEEWEKLRSAKAERMTSLGWLDYRRKLTSQKPKDKFAIIYNTSGTFITAAVVRSDSNNIKINGQEITLNGIIIDTKNYVMKCDNEKESYYLGSILNSSFLNEAVKPMQSRGLWGPRDFHKKILEFPIPLFDETNPSHQRLASLGQQCTQKVSAWLATGGPGQVKSIGRLRQMVRLMLHAELKEIDVLVKEILR